MSGKLGLFFFCFIGRVLSKRMHRQGWQPQNGASSTLIYIIVFQMRAPPQKICPHIKCIVSLSTQLLFVFDVHHLMLNIVFSHL